MTLLLDPKVESHDDEFKLMRDDPSFKQQGAFLERLWEQYQPYADRQFQTAFASEFHSRFWEMYLACCLLDIGYQLQPKVGKRAKGPDICLTKAGSRIWIEATAPGPGTGKLAVPEMEEAGWVPRPEIILRYCSAILDKYRKYSEYLESGIVDRNDPYVIAVSGAKLAWSIQDDYIPSIIQAAVPFGPYSVFIDKKSREVVGEGYEYRPKILKTSGESVSTRIFLDEEYTAVSGLLFSNATPRALSRYLAEEFIFFHNARAANPVPRGWLKIGKEYWMEGETLRGKRWNSA